MIPGQARSSLSSLSWPGARWLNRSRCSRSPARRGMEPVSCIRPASMVRRRTIDTTNSGRSTPIGENIPSHPQCHAATHTTLGNFQDRELPVRSPSITRDTSAKWRRPVEAILVATGRMSPMWVHSRAMYFFNREPTPRSSGSAKQETTNLISTYSKTGRLERVFQKVKITRLTVSVDILCAVNTEVELANQQPLETQQQIQRCRAFLTHVLRL